jgi:hypothetical protein
LTSKLKDGKTETITLEEVVYLLGSFKLISQSEIMDKDAKVKPVNHYSLNFFNHHGKLIAAACRIDGPFGLDRDPDLTEYTDIDNSWMLAFTTTGHAS